MSEFAASEVPAGCLARILPIHSGTPTGAGVLIAGNRILTCAHVVAKALGGDESEPERPVEEVAVDFPALSDRGSTVPLTATVVVGGWFPVRRSGGGDIAVLELREPAPPGACPPPMLRPPQLGGHPFVAIGFPEKREFGVPAHGEIDSRSGADWEWVALKQPDPTGYPVTFGFSGGPVWDTRAEAVVGIVVVVDHAPPTHVAFMIPVAVIAATWPRLEGSIGWRVRFDDVDRRRHWDPLARGVKDAGVAEDYFTGRGRALEHLVAWLESPDGRARVVTGRPGSGKSSVLARLVMAADDIERGRLALPTAAAAVASVPREHAIDLAIVARDLTLDELVTRIARWCDVHVDLADQPVATLVAQLRTRPAAPVIVIDQLDGALEPDRIVSVLLAELADAAAAHLLIGLQTAESSALLDLMQPWADRVDLDGDYEDARGLEDYIHRWLVEGDEYGADPQGVARQVARRAARRASPLFLVGQLVARWLRDQPMQADRPESDFPDDVPNAMRKYHEGLIDQLYRRGLEDHKQLGVVAEPRDVIKRRLDALMRALAYAEQPGLPADGDVWPAVGRAVGEDELKADDVRWLRRRADSFLVQVVDIDGTHHVRLFHEALVEAWRTVPEETAAIQGRIVEQLAALYPEGSAKETDGYVERRLPAHVAKAPLQTWASIAGRADLLDRLEPSSVRSHALRTALQRGSLPPEIGGVIQSQDLLMASEPEDRRALRQLGMARASDTRRFAPGTALVPRSAWTIRSAVVVQHPAHLPLAAGAPVTALVAFTGPRAAPIIAAGCEDGVVRLWDTATGERFGQSLRCGAAVRALAVCEVGGGVRLVSAGDDRVIRIWDPLRGGEPTSFHAPHEGVLRAVAAFAVDDALRIASVGDREHEIAIRDADGRRVATLAGPGPFRTLVAVPSDEAVALYAGSEGGSISVWSQGEDPGRDDGERATPPTAVLSGPTDWVRALCALALDGATHVAAAGDDRKLRIWRPPSPLPQLEAHTGHQAAILAIATYGAGEGCTVATAGADATIRLRNATTGEERGRPLTGHHGPICALAAYDLVDDTARLASAGEDGTLRLWDPRSAARIGPPRAHRVLAVAVHGDDLVITGGEDGRARLWNPTNGDLIGDFDARVGAIRAIVRGVGAMEYVFGGEGELVRFFDIVRRVETAPALEIHAGPVRALAGWPPDGPTMLASADDDGAVYLWKLDGVPALGGVIARKDNPIRGLAAFASADGPRLAVVGHGRTVELRGMVASDGSEAVLEGHQDWVMAVCAYNGPAGIACLATAGDDETVQTWSTLSGERLAVLGRHDGPIRAVAAFGVGDGARLVTAGDDKTVRIWDPVTAAEPHVLRLGATVNAVAPIAGGVVAGTDEGHIVIDLHGDLRAS